MVDVSGKTVVYRQASAIGEMALKPSTVEVIRKGKLEKGDPFPVARVAAILAAKNTSSIIPLCHNLSLIHISEPTRPY